MIKFFPIVLSGLSFLVGYRLINRSIFVFKKIKKEKLLNLKFFILNFYSFYLGNSILISYFYIQCDIIRFDDYFSLKYLKAKIQFLFSKHENNKFKTQKNS